MKVVLILLLATLFVSRKPPSHLIRNDNFFSQLVGSKQKNVVLFLLKENDGYSEQLFATINYVNKWLKSAGVRYKIYSFYCYASFCEQNFKTQFLPQVRIYSVFNTLEDQFVHLDQQVFYQESQVLAFIQN